MRDPADPAEALAALNVSCRTRTKGKLPGVLQVLTVYRYGSETYEVALTAGRDETVHAEPFDAVALFVGVFFGDDTPPPAGR
jgi:hypothetical protein